MSIATAGPRRLIDTDTHAVEAGDIWTSRMSKKRWGDDIPHTRFVAEQQSDVWFVRDHPVMPVGFSVIHSDGNGWIDRREESFPKFITQFSEMHPSAFDATERAKIMDAFGISTAVLYPNLGFVGADIYRVIPDSPLEFQVEIARCYNDWILEWAKAQPGRFIPIAAIPYWDVPSAVREIERCAEAGHRGFVTTGAPELHGEPLIADRHWDPVWAAAQATGLPISFHAGGAGEGFEELERRMKASGRYATIVAQTCGQFLTNASIASDLLMGNVLPRFPELRFIMVESGVGWIPFVLESLDFHFKKYRVERDLPAYDELPSFYFHRQVFANCWYEKVDQQLLEAVGPKNLLFETDYPHPTCLIEDEIDEVISRNLAALTEDQVEDVLWRNAARLFKLDRADVPEVTARVGMTVG